MLPISRLHAPPAAWENLGGSSEKQRPGTFFLVIPPKGCRLSSSRVWGVEGTPWAQWLEKKSIWVVFFFFFFFSPHGWGAARYRLSWRWVSRTRKLRWRARAAGWHVRERWFGRIDSRFRTGSHLLRSRWHGAIVDGVAGWIPSLLRGKMKKLEMCWPVGKQCCLQNWLFDWLMACCWCRNWFTIC